MIPAATTIGVSFFRSMERVVADDGEDARERKNHVLREERAHDCEREKKKRSLAFFDSR